MNSTVLFAGAASMILLGFVFDQLSTVSVGLGLMWIGLSIIAKNK